MDFTSVKKLIRFAVVASLATLTALCAAQDVASVTINKTQIVGGADMYRVGTVNLDMAPSVNTVVTLSSSSNLVVPATVTVPKNKTKATFHITAPDLNTTTETGTVWAMVTSTQNATIDVIPLICKAPIWPGGYLVAGSTQIGHVNMNIASAVDRVVTLSSNNANVVVPATVTVPAGDLGTTFSIVLNTSASGGCQISATFNGTTLSRHQPVVDPKITSFMLTSPVVTGGTSTMGTVQINYVLTSDLDIDLSSDNTSAASVGSTVTIHAGDTSATFTVTTYTVATKQMANITAGIHGVSKMKKLTVNP